LRGEIPYESGVREGMTKLYYKNGNLKWSVLYKKGIRVGAARLYYNDGRVKAEITYKNGRKRRYNCVIQFFC
jgi:antitoxin component YwqK of YwqJK toxin-antitoxin module